MFYAYFNKIFEVGEVIYLNMLINNMKQQQDKGPKFDVKTYNELTIRKRMLDKEIQSIKTMTYQQLLNKGRRKEECLPPSPTKQFFRQKFANDLKEAGFEDRADQLAERHMNMMEEVQRNNIIKRKEMKKYPIWSQIKRGSMGFDGVLVLFGIFGSFLLPVIFYNRFKKNKEIIVKSRKYTPEQIENINDPDCQIDLDQISQHTIHYDNPSRRKQVNELIERSEKMSALKRELDL